MFIVNVEAVVWRDRQFLMSERGVGESRGVGWLSFPGGKVEWDGAGRDVLERTAARELREEVGLAVDGPWHYVENKLFAIGDLPVLDVVLLARSVAGDPFIAAPEEVAAVAWMTAPEILADPRTQPWTRDSLARSLTLLDKLGW
jgi:ADP-ribose pyrophosphatase YjhB (NUDIX family)